MIFGNKIMLIQDHVVRVSLKQDGVSFRQQIQHEHVCHKERIASWFLCIINIISTSIFCYHQAIIHNPNSRLIAVVGDGEYVIYTAQALRNKAFGGCSEFIWSWDGNCYATLDATGKITVFHDFHEKFSFKAPFQVEEIFAGRLIGRGLQFIRGHDCARSWR